MSPAIDSVADVKTASKVTVTKGVTVTFVIIWLTIIQELV